MSYKLSFITMHTYMHGEVGKDFPMASASWTLNNSENNYKYYNTTELKCLAIIFGVYQFKPFSYDKNL